MVYGIIEGIANWKSIRRRSERRSFACPGEGIRRWRRRLIRSRSKSLLNVLIVDDEPRILEGLGYLRCDGHSVSTAASGREAEKFNATTSISSFSIARCRR
jgi:hypothetical protein